MNATDGARNPLAMLADIAACLAFMTRLDIKIPGLDGARPIGHGAWALPLAGAFMGAVAGAAYAIATGFGFGPLLAAALAVAAGAWATGARGEWGLASATDAASGGPFGGGGATALVLAIVLRLATIAALDDFAVVMAAMMAAVALGAAATAGVLYYLPASGADRAPTHNVLVACVVAAAIALLVLPFGGFAAVIIVIVVAIAVAAAHARWVGETTPAALGAVQLACETAALLAIAASA